MLLEKTSSVNMEEHFDEYEHYNFQFDKQIFSGENCQNFEKIVLSKVELSNFRIKRTLALLTKHFSQIVVKSFRYSNSPYFSDSCKNGERI